MAIINQLIAHKGFLWDRSNIAYKSYKKEGNILIEVMQGQTMTVALLSEINKIKTGMTQFNPTFLGLSGAPVPIS